jgi:paraquat-inducible protein B
MHPTQPESAPELPMPRVVRKRRRHQGWVWLIPIVAALIGLSIVWHQISNRGPTITISFQSASGLEEGKTQIRYRDVVVGVVQDIRLSANRERVLVDAQLDKDAAGLANEGSVFWVVRPSIGLNGVSGLATLFSGAYIEADSEDSFHSTPRIFEFEGLEKAPPIKSDRPGKPFRLRAESLGSVTEGAPVYYRRIPVGIVTGYSLDKSGDFLYLDVFIDAPYDKFVNANSRFWNESGIYFNVNADGLTVRTESLASIISGGLAFANFGPHQPINEQTVFKLYDDHRQAEQVPTGLSIPVTMRFYQSTRGLEVGAPIDFQGIHLGVVDSVELRYDKANVRLYTQVTGTLYPARMGPAFVEFADQSRDLEEIGRNMVRFVHRGLRAQLRTSSVLSGSSYIALGFHDSPVGTQRVEATLPFNIPTVPSEGLEELQRQITSIVAQLERIPFESIGKSLDEGLKELTEMARNMDATVTPELNRSMKALQKTLAELDKILGSSDQLPDQIERSMQELDRAIRSTRALVDELRAKPNSLIFGVPNQTYSRDTLGEGP